MRIITANAFTAELNIAGVDNPTINRLNEFIDKYTKKFLKQLYGDNMGNLFISALNEQPPISAGNRFYDLAQDSDLQNSLACYVYYWFQRDNVSFSSSQGEKRAKASNSTDVEMGYKVSRAWNEMVDYCRNVNVDATVFPEYVKYNWYYCNGTRWYDRGYSAVYQFEQPREIYFPINPLF